MMGLLGAEARRVPSRLGEVEVHVGAVQGASASLMASTYPCTGATCSATGVKPPPNRMYLRLDRTERAILGARAAALSLDVSHLDVR